MSGGGIREVEVEPIALERLGHLIGPERVERFEHAAADARGRLGDRRVVNVNSTATGGGVAELLQTLLAYARGAGIDARWVVIEGDAGFFEITKRIHNHLYGTAGDGGPLGADEHQHYEEVTSGNADALRAFLRSGDIVILHDPQTAALARVAMPAGVSMVWRCHVGLDHQNAHSEQAWAFLRPYLEDVDAFVFSREQFAPPWIPRERLAIISPSIDPFSAKNEEMDPDLVQDVLMAVGLVAGRDGTRAMRFTRRDGSTGTIARRVDLLGTGPLPAASMPMVLQASRWDTMKDMRGVMEGFAHLIATNTDAHLVLAGPETTGVADDPEADRVLRECRDDWERLPENLRRRIHLACVPMADGDEAAAIVNALQRHATVVVQKSLAEGFGLTVTEAMWKARPVVGSAVGGIVDQIVPGETGWLVAADDLDDYARAVCSLLRDVPGAKRMGAAGRDRALTHFLGDRHLEQWAALFEHLI